MSPVAVLVTVSAVVPIGNPSGTTTVSRRSPVDASTIVATVLAAALRGAGQRA